MFIYLISYERTIGTSETPGEERQHKSCRLRQTLEDFSLKQPATYPELPIPPCEDLIIAHSRCCPATGTDMLGVPSTKVRDSLPGNRGMNRVAFLPVVNSSLSLQSTFF